MSTRRQREALELLRSIACAKLETRKPALSQRLADTGVRVADEAGASVEAIKPPAAKLFATRDNPIARAHATINGMSLFMRSAGRGLPSPFEGTVYVRVQSIPEIQEEFDRRTRILQTCFRELRATYPDLVAAGKARVARLAHEVEWPTLEQFLGGYVFRLHWLGSVNPLTNEVLKGVAREVRNKVRLESEQSTYEALLQAHAAPIREVVTLLGESVEQILHGSRLRQERFEQIRQAARNLTESNWLNLPEFAEFARRVEACYQENAPALSDTERQAAAQQIADTRDHVVAQLENLGL